MSTAPSRESAPQPIVETTYGKVRGTVCDGVNIFRGIPYGDSTAGVNRFMPPLAAKPIDHARRGRSARWLCSLR